MQQPNKFRFTPEERNRLEKERAADGLAIGWQVAGVIAALAVTLWMGLGFLLTLGSLAAAFGGLLIQGSMNSRGSLRRDLFGGEKWICRGFLEEKRKRGRLRRITVHGCDFTVDEKLASTLEVGDFVRVGYAPESAYVFEIDREADGGREASVTLEDLEPRRLESTDRPATASTRSAATEAPPSVPAAGPAADARPAAASGASVDDALARYAGAELAHGADDLTAAPLECKRCGCAFRAEDVHRDLGIARCSHCSTIHDLLLRAEPAPRNASRPAPDTIGVEEKPGALRLSWYSFSGTRLLPLAGLGLWLLLFCDWFPATFGGPDAVGSTEKGQLLWLVVAGLALGYASLACLFNFRQVEIADRQLRVRMKPLPWPGSKTVSTDEIEQLCAQEVVATDKDGTRVIGRSYCVWIVFRSDARPLELADGLKSAEAAFFLERRIEEELGIVDRPSILEVPANSPRKDAKEQS